MSGIYDIQAQSLSLQSFMIFHIASHVSICSSKSSCLQKLCSAAAAHSPDNIRFGDVFAGLVLNFFLRLPPGRFRNGRDLLVLRKQPHCFGHVMCKFGAAVGIGRQ